MPSWVAVSGLVGTLCGLLLLMLGRDPWRATRWGWFWLVSSPIGALAFLVFSGPTPLLSRRPWDRRLPGPLTFFLAIVLNSLLATLLVALGSLWR